MMGEYILYYREKVIGGIYDDRFLIKPTPSAERIIPDAKKELPYDGAKPMMLVEDTDNRDLLRELITSMWNELPQKKKR